MIVPGYGPTPNKIFLCGEAPGYNESVEGRPFVGRSGQEQERYLSLYGVSSALWYKTNVVKWYVEGNPDPAYDDILQWSPVLYDELSRVKPHLIIAVGKFAAQWFLGDDATMELCHGIPHKPGAFDASRMDRGGPYDNVVVLPIYHPAAGFHNNDLRPSIAWDYSRVAKYVKLALKDRLIPTTHDEYAGCESYEDATGDQIVSLLHFDRPNEIAIDTEWDERGPWSIQLCYEPSRAYVLRTAQDDFKQGIAGIQQYLDKYHPLIDYHFALVDAPQCRKMGLETNRCPWWGTEYAAYIMRIEGQGLKQLAWRWCGMMMEDYKDVVGDTCKAARLEYLQRALDVSKGIKPPRYIEDLQNDGTHKRTKPKSMHALISSLLRDIDNDKRDKHGNAVDIRKRWYDFRHVVRQPVEQIVGPLPFESLEYVEPRSRAIYYAGRDADATYRLKPVLNSQLC